MWVNNASWRLSRQRLLLNYHINMQVGSQNPFSGHMVAHWVYLYMSDIIYTMINDYQIVPGTRWGGSFEHWKALQEEDGLQESLGAEATRCSSCGVHQWICESMNRWVIELMKERSNEQSDDESINQWIKVSANQWSKEATKQWTNKSTNEWSSESVKQWTNEATKQWVNDSTDQRINESINQQINEPRKHWIKKLMNQWVNQTINPK